MNEFNQEMIDKYRKIFGCKNIGEVCWCEVCCSIEKLISDTKNRVIKIITDD